MNIAEARRRLEAAGLVVESEGRLPNDSGYQFRCGTKVELGAVWTYGWNVENQLVRVCRDAEPCTDANALARFAYDALGRRVEKAAGGVTTSILYDGDDILRETRSDGTTYTYVHGPGIDEPLAREDQAGNRVYYHADGLGSIVKLSDATGSVVASYSYDAWGNPEGAVPEGYAFTGREHDAETGLMYYRARYYDAKLGRFISEDPLGFAGGVNLYAYVSGNPTRFTDPLGLEKTEEERQAEIDAFLQEQARIFDENLDDNLGNAIPMAGGLRVAGKGALRLCKSVNLPSWRRIGIRMGHVLSGHTKGGSRASAIKDLFPESMNARTIERAIREAYRYGEKLGTQGERVLVEGTTSAGLRIRMWVNKATEMIEAA